MGFWVQWHQPDHMQTICTSLQRDNHTNNTPSLNFYSPGALPDAQTTVSNHLRPNPLNHSCVHNEPAHWAITLTQLLVTAQGVQLQHNTSTGQTGKLPVDHCVAIVDLWQLMILNLNKSFRFNIPTHNEETRELPGERDNARNNARCMYVRKTIHGPDGQHQDMDMTPRGRVAAKNNMLNVIQCQ